MSTVTHYSFGSFELYPTEQLLVRDHQPIPLSPKAFDLLVTLVSNHGRLMTRETLMKTIWPDSFVEETNLTVNISLLCRRFLALGDHDSAIRWISKAFDERAGSLIYLNVDRAFDPLRNDPRFLADVKRANLVPRVDETASR
jgi:hypothetical protein